MKVLAMIVVALLAPVAAAAKGPVFAEMCGPDDCRAVDLRGFWHGSEAPPAAGPYYELRYDGRATGAYYEPRSGLVAQAEEWGAVAWSQQRIAVDGLRPFPRPRVTAAWVGERKVSGDPSGYLRLVTLTGPFVVPDHLTHFVWIRLESPTPNPWTSQALVYYPRDRVLLTQGSVYVRVPDSIAAALEAARPLPGAPRPIPWLPAGVAVAGLVGLLSLRHRRARADRALRAVSATS